MSASGTSRRSRHFPDFVAIGCIADITQTDPHGTAFDPKGLLLPVAGFASDKGIYRNQSIRRETFHNATYAWV